MPPVRCLTEKTAPVSLDYYCPTAAKRQKRMSVPQITFDDKELDFKRFEKQKSSWDEQFLAK